MTRSRTLPPAKAEPSALDRHWQLYVRAMKQAQASGSIRDGIAAGEAWRSWLALFLPAEHGELLGKRSAG